MKADDGQALHLATRRLELTPLGESDLELLHEHWSVPEVGRWLWDDEVPTSEQVAEELAKSVATFSSRGFGIWGLFGRDGGSFIGTCGLLPVPEGTGEIEVLFSVEPREWRRGFAAEAAEAIIAYGFGAAGLEEILGRCDVPNEPSRRLLEKLGMVLEGRAPIKGIECYHYRLRNPRQARP